MWTRILEYLKPMQSALSPADYVMQTAEKWEVTDRLDGRGIIMMGDLINPCAGCMTGRHLQILIS